jgi:hypothetical protein
MTTAGALLELNLLAYQKTLSSEYIDIVNRHSDTAAAW